MDNEIVLIDSFMKFSHIQTLTGKPADNGCLEIEWRQLLKNIRNTAYSWAIKEIQIIDDETLSLSNNRENITIITSNKEITEHLSVVIKDIFGLQ